ncbi:tumor necrosis factor ligand superfamily member 6 [Sardina pilchardus]|uniref:tumor necrosis factor ligand superfamily member 6 n=1 Tax=Sardina pilchardus TaxID=27697 RepID=UPI002E126F6B
MVVGGAGGPTERPQLALYIGDKTHSPQRAQLLTHTHTHTLVDGNMAGRQPQMFLVDGGDNRQMHPPPYPPRMEPGTVPCWTFPPARQRKRSWTSSCSAGSVPVTILVMVLALVFAALGLGAYEIQNLQSQLANLTKNMDDTASQGHFTAPQSQIGFHGDIVPTSVNRQAAHVTVNTDQHHGAKGKTLQWVSDHGRAFTEGVVYSEGGLQVNSTGIYFIYSRVEILGNECPKDRTFLHTVWKKASNMVLMRGHKALSCKQTTREVWTSHSYLGAVLMLNKHDWVYVNASHPSFIDHSSPRGNYFGLYQIF